MQRLKDIIGLFAIFLVGVFLYCPLAAAEGHVPFQPGERLHFVLKYGAIPAGEATLEVHEMDEMQGIEAYHFVLTARSNSFVDIFFKVRDRIESYADAGMNHSLYYKKDQKEGKTRRNIKVNFDWNENESTYVNFDTAPKIISLMPKTFDPLAIFYYSRLLDLQNEEIFEHPVTDGQKNMLGLLRVVGKETINVPAGTFETLVLEPDLKKVDGVFFKEERAKIKIWLSDDERRLLVKMKSKVKVGSFVAELVTVEGLKPLKMSSLRDIE